MTQLISIKEDSSREPGYVLLSFADLPARCPNVELALVRSGFAHAYFGQSGWQAEEAWLEPADCWWVDDVCKLVLPPEVTDELDIQSYELVLWHDQTALGSLTFFWPGFPLAESEMARVPASAPAAPIEADLAQSAENVKTATDAVPAPQRAPEPASSAQPGKSSAALGWMAVAVLGIGAATYFALQRAPDTTSDAGHSSVALVEQSDSEEALAPEIQQATADRAIQIEQTAPPAAQIASADEWPVEADAEIDDLMPNEGEAEEALQEALPSQTDRVAADAEETASMAPVLTGTLHDTLAVEEATASEGEPPLTEANLESAPKLVETTVTAATEAVASAVTENAPTTDLADHQTLDSAPAPLDPVQTAAAETTTETRAEPEAAPVESTPNEEPPQSTDITAPEPAAPTVTGEDLLAIETELERMLSETAAEAGSAPSPESLLEAQLSEVTGEGANLSTQVARALVQPPTPSAPPQPSGQITVRPDSAHSGTLGVIIQPLGNDLAPEGGEPLYLESVQGADHGRVELLPNAREATRLRYIPNADFSGVDTLTYLVRSGPELRASGQIRVHISQTPGPANGDDIEGRAGRQTRTPSHPEMDEHLQDYLSPQ